jgi:hypothetical protein
MQADICRHIKTSGAQCRAVALTGSPFCYFHRRLHTAHAPYRHSDATRGYLLPGQHIQLAPLEDRESVLLAASQVVNALATGNLDIKRATALLYGLQVAGAYAPHASPEAAPQSLTRNVHTATGDSETPGVDLASPGHVCEVPADPTNTSRKTSTRPSTTSSPSSTAKPHSHSWVPHLRQLFRLRWAERQPGQPTTTTHNPQQPHSIVRAHLSSHNREIDCHVPLK